MSRISADAGTRLGLTERPNEWCQVRPCNAAGRQEDEFLAKIASVLEIAPQGYPTTRRPREQNFRRPDVVVGTRDWEAVERFLCNVGPDRNAELGETRKQHIRIVLQDGERWYLNLLMSETSMAAAKLGRGSVHDKRMHLRDVNGKEVSITVDVVDTTKELLVGEDPPPGMLRPHMVLTPGDERRIQGMMLTGWMGKADLLKGWASQGKKKGQPTLEAGGREAGEQGEDGRANAAHLRIVRPERAEYDDRVRSGNDTRPEGWQSQPPGHHGGRKEGDQLRLVRRASAGCGRKHLAGEGEWCGEHGPHQGRRKERRGLRRPPRRDRGVYPGVGVRRPDHRPRQHGLQARGDPWLAWMAGGRMPHEGHREPRGLRQDGARRVQREELRGSRVLTSSRQGSVSHLWCEHFYRLLSSCCDTEKGGGKGKGHWFDNRTRLTAVQPGAT